MTRQCSMIDSLLMRPRVGLSSWLVPTETPDLGEPVDTAAWTEGASQLIARATSTGDLAGLHRAVTLFDQVLRATPPGSPNHKAAALNLASALVRQFESTTKVEALD